MVKRVRTDLEQTPKLREQMAAHYESLCASRPWARDRQYGQRLDKLRSGEPLVLPGWALRRFHVPVVRRGAGAFYRVEPDGRVVEVIAVRDPADRMSIVDWAEVV